MIRFILATLIMNSTFASAGDLVTLDKNWIFKNAQGDAKPVDLNRSLIDQFTNKNCCNGTYKRDIEVSEIASLGSIKEIGLFIPGVAGLEEIRIDGASIPIPKNDFSSTGPVISLSTATLDTKVTIEIEVGGFISDFAGVWKGAPIIGDIYALNELRQSKTFFQQVSPLLNGIVLIIFAITFFLIHLIVGKKNRIYFNFGYALLAWGVYYAFLSGYLRSVNFAAAVSLQNAVRILAAGGLTLVVQRCSKRLYNNFTVLSVFLVLSVISLAFGLLQMPVHQKALVALVAPLAFFPILGFSWRRSDLVGKIIFALSSIAFFGQCSDSFKLICEIVGFSYHFPYLNRFTFLPLLVASFGDCIVQFSGSFHQLRTHLFKAKSYARTILHSAKEGLSHDNVNYFLKVTSKICGFNRVSLAQKQEDGSYKVIKLYGSKFSAEGSTISLDKSTDIKSSVINGKVVFGSVQGIADGWKTSEFVAVPVPEEKNPPYLMLLSDPKKTNLNSKDVLPYLSQISSAIWTNLERTKEQNLRVQTEKKFSSLVQKLDPSLYEFITSNMNKIADPDQMVSSTRGIVFFDQKAYSTMTEDFDDATMGKFARIVGEWVTDSAARYGARISNFAGDAFLLETFSIGSESEESIAERTMNLVWNLAQTMGELNQILLKEGFTPVTFRFGAHIGNVAAANLDFIQKGLSNSIGDTVNVAARLQSLAKAGSIYISGELEKYVLGKFVTTPVPKQYVKGRMRKIDIFSLVGKVESSIPDTKRIA